MKALALYARFLIVLVAAQFYAAGLAIFGATTFVPHATIGWSFIVLSLVLVVWAIASRSRRELSLVSAGVLLLTVSQPIIVFGLRQWPPVAALHPVVGLAIAAMLLVVARRSSRLHSRS